MALLVDKMITDEFVADIRRDSLMPAVQSQWSDQRILDVAYDEVLSSVAVPLTEIDHSYYREAEDITLVAGQSAYDVPRYAMLGKIHLLQLVNTSGAIDKLDRMDPPEEEFFKSTTSGHPKRVRVDGSQIIVNPAPTAADIVTWPTLRAYIYRRPSRMVRLTTSGTNAARAFTVSTAAAALVTYTAATTAMTDFTSSSVHDFYDGVAPFRRIGSAKTATAKAAATTQGFATATVALLSAGDFVCMRDETCVVPIPSAELLKPLRQLVIASIAATFGEKAAYTTALEQFTGKVATLFPAASNRLQGNLAAMTLLHSPFLRGLRSGRGMVTD